VWVLHGETPKLAVHIIDFGSYQGTPAGFGLIASTIPSWWKHLIFL